METVKPQEQETLADVLYGVEKEVKDTLGSETLAFFITHDYRFNGLHNLTVHRGRRYTRWVEDSDGISREVLTFPGGLWQIKTTLEYLDKNKGVLQLNILASKDPSGRITVEGQLPISVVEAYLLDTSGGQIDQYRSQLFKTLWLIKSKSFAVQCKLTSSGENSYVGLPLTD